MANTQTSRNILPIQNIFTLSGEIFLRNFILFSVLIIVIHYIAYSFVGNLWQSIEDYIYSVYSWDFGKFIQDSAWTLAKSVSILGENYQIRDHAQKLITDAQLLLLFVSYITLILVVFVQLICTLLDQRGRLKLTPPDVLACFKRHNFAIYIYRTVGILAVFLPGLFLIDFISAIVTYAIAQIISNVLSVALENFMSIFKHTLMGIVCICAFSRFLLAIPVCVVENKRVMESIKLSWKITSSSWPRMLAIWLLTGVCTFVIHHLLYLAFELIRFTYRKISSIDEKAEIKFAIFGGDVWTCVVIGGAVIAIVVSVCYHFLRENLAQ